jgi:methylglutaconyl-CoA hydratase
MLEIDIHDRVATLTLNRPEVSNAFNQEVMLAIDCALRDIAVRNDVRVLVLTGAGKHFSAGADLNWMKNIASAGETDNMRDAEQLANMMRHLNQFPKPVVARINGAAFGGAVGLTACSDIAIASSKALFCLSEVRLGLVPAVISPYVVQAMGPQACRRYFLSGEVFDAETAFRLGLVQEVAAPENLDRKVAQVVDQLCQGGPVAQTTAKRLIRQVVRASPSDPHLHEDTARLIARLRNSPEGQEGLGAFLEKRKPAWQETKKDA